MADEIIDKPAEDDVLVEEDLTSLDESTDWKSKAEELEQKRREDGIRQRERSKALKQQLADAKKAVDDAKKSSQKADAPKTGELDETQLDYLDLKGISDEDEIAVIQKVMKNTGLTLRQALKDDYVVSKLKDLKDAKDNKVATPTSTKRTGAQETNLEVAIAKYEKDPKSLESLDFDTRKKVVNAMYQRKNSNKPAWH